MAFEWEDIQMIRPRTRRALAELRALIEPYPEIIYVDGKVSASGDGSTWEKACKTIQEGVNIARYDPGTTDINDDKDHYAIVYVAPGQYNEQILFSGYNISLIGVQPEIGNADYGGVTINYDGAVSTTAVVGFSGSGIRLENLTINCTEAIPALFGTIADGCWIKNVKIKGDATNCTFGIDIGNCKSTVIEGCQIEGAVTAGIRVGEGAGGDTYFCSSSIRNNIIRGAGTTGILVHSSAVASNVLGSEILQNRIIGACTTGIHQDHNTAFVLIADNWIQAGTAVTDDGTGAADNHTAA